MTQKYAGNLTALKIRHSRSTPKGCGAKHSASWINIDRAVQDGMGGGLPETGI